LAQHAEQSLVEPEQLRSHRTSYPRKKVETLSRVQELASKYNTLIATKLYKVRASQLMALRKNFKSELVIFVAKNKIAGLGLQKSSLQKADDFVSRLEGQNALIFTNMNPFKLYLVLEKSKVNLPARGGDIANEVIVVPAGNTGIPPGPVLSEFKDAGVQTRIESGSIFVSRDSIVARPGDVISPKLAGLLARLNLKPIRAGLSIAMALSDGLLLFQKDISIDPIQYQSDLSRAVAEAIGLAVETSYMTKESAPLLLAKAMRSATALSTSSGYITAENAGSVLSFAEAQARTLSAAATSKGYKHQ
jgi:large subunit ribosomal protein L10